MFLDFKYFVILIWCYRLFVFLFSLRGGGGCVAGGGVRGGGGGASGTLSNYNVFIQK